MNEKEELIFGLKRWLKKGVDYLKDKSPEELMKDELTFDALCFVFLMIKDITNRILSYPELLKRHSNVNFIEIKDLYYDVFIKDGCNVYLMHEYIKNKFPHFIEELNK